MKKKITTTTKKNKEKNINIPWCLVNRYFRDFQPIIWNVEIVIN